MRIDLKHVGLVSMAMLVATGVSAAPPLFELKIPLGSIAPKIPQGNELTQAKVDLGKKLFFDTSFSYNGKTACATCHIPEHGFADIRPMGFTSSGGELHRNTPTTVNAAMNDFQFWDGRAASLEDQVADVARPGGDTSIHINTAVKICQDSKDYVDLFQQAFNNPPDAVNFCQAISSWERTAIAGNTRFDRYEFGGDKSALTRVEQKGLEVFKGKGNCVVCHTITNKTETTPAYATFIDQNFHNIGVGAYGTRLRDSGRYLVTGDKKDFGAFKTPTLRNVALTSPYMHDGSLPTLDAVVNYLDRGGNANTNLDPEMKRLDLTGDEKHALVAFLKSLSDEKLEKDYLPVSKIQARIDAVLKQ